jgi:hypothetical protein
VKRINKGTGILHFPHSSRIMHLQEARSRAIAKRESPVLLDSRRLSTSFTERFLFFRERPGLQEMSRLAATPGGHMIRHWNLLS